MASPTMTDPYPSRVGDGPGILDREDPVVYGGPSDGPLRPEQLDTFGRDGFLRVDTVFSVTLMRRFLAEAMHLAARPEIHRDERTVTDPVRGEVHSIFEVHLQEVFSEVVADHRLAGVARQLLGSDVYVHQSRLEVKPGFRGRESYWHSDFETWHAEDGMPAMRAVSASIMLTPHAEWSGPLMIIPGSHRRFVACVGPTPDEESLAWLVARAGDDIASVPGPTGSVVFFDCNAMHGSASNISPLPCTTVCFVYNSVDNTLREPYATPTPRPAFIANRDFTPV